MLCKFYWIVLYTVHFTAFSLGGPFFYGHGVCNSVVDLCIVFVLCECSWSAEADWQVITYVML